MSENVNENTVENAEPIVVDGGSTFSSFEDLERIHGSDPDKISFDEVKEEGDKPKESKEESKDDESEDKAEPESDDKEEDSKDGESEESDDEVDQKEVEDLEKEIKLIKYKLGEEEHDIRADSLIPVKIDGETEFHKLQDVMNNFSGRQSLDRKYTQYNEDHKKIEGVKEELTTVMADLAGHVQSENPLDAMRYLTELTGHDFGEWRKRVVGALESEVERRAGMTDEEKRYEDLQREKEDLAGQLTKFRETEEYRETQKGIESRTDEIMENKGMGKEDFISIYQGLIDSGTPRDEITPELVGEYYTAVTHKESLESLVGEVNPELSPEGIDAAVDDLNAVQERFGDLTMEELRDIAVEVYGSKKAKNLSRKVRKSGPVDTAKPHKPKDPDDVWNFDQLG